MSNKKYYAHIINFGCRLNRYESDAMSNGLVEKNICITSNPQKADYIIINACSVTNVADYKNRAAIRKIHKFNENSKIIVTGCYATTDKEEIEKENVYKVVSNQEKANIPTIIESDLKNINYNLKKNNPFGYSYIHKINRARAYLKIQDGCNRKCSYCKIPISRGRAQSRNFEECLEEFKHLIRIGFQEIILTGVNIGSYSYQKKNFYDILETLLNQEGKFYIRISSIEPPHVNERFANLYKHSNMGKFLHIPLQSGSKEILKKMVRGYTLEKFEKAIHFIRKTSPNIHIGTDIIVGFPSETEENFAETMNFVKKMQFDNIHIFPFSKRKESSIFQKIQEKNIQEVHGNIIKDRIKKLQNLQKKIQEQKELKEKKRIMRGIIIQKKSPTAFEILTENYVKLQLSSNYQNFSIGEMISVAYDKNRKVELV